MSKVANHKLPLVQIEAMFGPSVAMFTESARSGRVSQVTEPLRCSCMAGQRCVNAHAEPLPTLTSLSITAGCSCIYILMPFQGYVHEVYHTATSFFCEAVCLQVFICYHEKVRPRERRRRHKRGDETIWNQNGNKSKMLWAKQMVVIPPHSWEWLLTFADDPVQYGFQLCDTDLHVLLAQREKVK